MSNQQELQTCTRTEKLMLRTPASINSNPAFKFLTFIIVFIVSTTPGYPYPVPGALAVPPQQYIPETATTISPQYFYYPDPTMTQPQQPNPYATNQTFQPNYDARPVPIANDSNGVGLESVDHGYDPEQPTRVVYVYVLL
jgi:hypothetical protein